MARSLSTPRNFATRPLKVTVIPQPDSQAKPWPAYVHEAQDVRDLIAGNLELICSECGEGSSWCPDLMEPLAL